MKFILGPLIIIIGILMMKYTVALTEFTGKLDFAEKYLKPGGAGTYTWWRLVGLAFIIISIMWMAGALSFTTVPGLLN